jgi:hypothetical protein
MNCVAVCVSLQRSAEWFEWLAQTEAQTEAN